MAAIRSPDLVLNEIVQIFNKAASYDEALREMHHLVTTDFDPTWMHGMPPQLSATEACVVGDTATAIVMYMDRHPNIAVLKIVQEEWLLKAFVSGCPACFMTGIIMENRICPSCGGSGWGTLGDLPFC